MAHGDLRISGSLDRGRALSILVDGEWLTAYEGESVAAALIASGRRLTRFTARAGEARGYFCGIGVCHDCLIAVDGQPNVRACMTPVKDGQHIQTQHGLGEWRAT